MSLDCRMHAETVVGLRLGASWYGWCHWMEGVKGTIADIVDSIDVRVAVFCSLSGWHLFPN